MRTLYLLLARQRAQRRDERVVQEELHLPSRHRARTRRAPARGSGGQTPAAPGLSIPASPQVRRNARLLRSPTRVRDALAPRLRPALASGLSLRLGDRPVVVLVLFGEAERLKETLLDSRSDGVANVLAVLANGALDLRADQTRLRVERVE